MPFLPQPVFTFNMVCTNVPGPMVPLYVNGRELLTYYPHVPCGSEVGISVAISSYNQNLYYGVTYDAQAAPDGELFRDFLIESYEELRDAAGIVSMPVSRPGRQEPVVSQDDPRAHRGPHKPSVPETAVEQEQKPIEASEAELPPGQLPEAEPVVSAEVRAPVTVEAVVGQESAEYAGPRIEAEVAPEVAPDTMQSEPQITPVESSEIEPAVAAEVIKSDETAIAVESVEIPAPAVVAIPEPVTVGISAHPRHAAKARPKTGKSRTGKAVKNGVGAK
jgi:hypothetical protein